MSPEPDVRHVLRDIWQARQQTGADLDELFGPPKTCKNMRHVGFQGDAGGPVDGDLREAWRNRLAREGKLHPDRHGVRDLIPEPHRPR
jgi:hypothetical protein